MSFKLIIYYLHNNSEVIDYFEQAFLYVTIVIKRGFLRFGDLLQERIEVLRFFYDGKLVQSCVDIKL
jgi:hypothetical protein